MLDKGVLTVSLWIGLWMLMAAAGPTVTAIDCLFSPFDFF